jgi:hypothetical protein
MQAKKAKLEATLPPIEQARVQPLKPVVVNTVPKQEEKKDEEKEVKIDVSQFVADPKQEEKEEEKGEEEGKDDVVENKEVKKSDEEEPRNWKWMYRSLEGNHQLLVKENRDLRDKLIELETKLDLTLKEKQKSEVKVEEPLLDLSPEELEEYGHTLPVMNKILTKQWRQIENDVIKPLQNEIVELKKSTSDVAAKSISTDEGNFVQQVRAQVKNIGGDFDIILKDKKWNDFIDRPLGAYSDITIGQALWDAHKKRSLDKVVKVFEDFIKASKTNGAGDAYKAPSVSAATGALPTDEKKPKLKISKREEASIKFRKRQISTEEYEQIRDMYRIAEAEGRIDYTQ